MSTFAVHSILQKGKEAERQGSHVVGKHGNRGVKVRSTFHDTFLMTWREGKVRISGVQPISPAGPGSK